jgi:PAS domain S-box-containing protein
MGDGKPTYEELQARLAEAESIVNAIRNEEIDALIGQHGVYLLRLKELEEALLVSENNLRKSEAKFRAAFTNASIGLAMTLPDGRFVDANPTYCSITGYPMEELRALKLFQLIHPKDFPENMRLIDQMLTGQINDFVLENRYLNKQGEIVWIRNSVSLVRNAEGSPQWIIALIENITDYKRTEEALFESVAKVEEGELTLNTLMECVPEGITIAKSPDVYIVRVSRFGKELLGKRSEQLEGLTADRHVRSWDIYEQDGKAAAKMENLPLTRAIQLGEIVKNEEWLLGKADGSRIPIICNASPIRGESGKIIGGIVAWRDISERKRLEEVLRASNQELTEYAYAVTHNLKAPLRAIQNYVDFLFEDLADTLEGEPKTYLEGIKNAVIQGNNQFEDLEALYHIKNYEANFEQFEMRELLNEIQSMFRNNSDQKLIFTQNWPVFKCERFLLRQILIHLISNGFKFNRADIKRVEVGWQPSANGRIEIFVRDNGIGIELPHQEQIFKIFRRLHTDREYAGTGIGLAIVKRAAQRIGGTLRVESAVGEGSTFYVNLPNSIFVKT